MKKVLTRKEIEQLKPGVIIAKEVHRNMESWEEETRYRFIRLGPVTDSNSCKFWVYGEMISASQLTGRECAIGCECQLRPGSVQRLVLITQPKCIYCGANTEPYKDKAVCIECYRVQE